MPINRRRRTPDCYCSHAAHTPIVESTIQATNYRLHTPACNVVIPVTRLRQCCYGERTFFVLIFSRPNFEIQKSRNGFEHERKRSALTISFSSPTMLRLCVHMMCSAYCVQCIPGTLYRECILRVPYGVLALCWFIEREIAAMPIRLYLSGNFRHFKFN